MGEAAFTHVLFTRFNVRWTDTYKYPGHDPEWLRDRFRLFDRFCYPSVRAQDSQQFVWLVFFDEGTPEPFRTHIHTYQAAYGNFVPVFVPRFDPSVLIDTLRHRGLLDTPYLITSRLDNDDAIARNYIRRAQRHASFGTRQWINFDHGLVLVNGRLYKTCDPHSHFASLVEPSHDPMTAYRDHSHLSEFAPVNNVRSEGPAWLEVRHPGRLTDKHAHRSWMPTCRLLYKRQFPGVVDMHEGSFRDCVNYPVRLGYWIAYRVARKVRSSIVRNRIHF